MRFSSELLVVLARVAMALRQRTAAEPLSLLRRSTIVLVALCTAAYAGRHGIAYGLVARGDDVLRGGSTLVRWNQPAPMVYYERAHGFDPQWDVPVDRFTFAASTTFDRATLRRGVALSTAYLRAHPGAASIRRSRAFCALHLGDVRLALSDVRILVEVAPRDWRLIAMAAGLARRLGDDRESTSLYARAERVRTAQIERHAAS